MIILFITTCDIIRTPTNGSGTRDQYTAFSLVGVQLNCTCILYCKKINFNCTSLRNFGAKTMWSKMRKISSFKDRKRKCVN